MTDTDEQRSTPAAPAAPAPAGLGPFDAVVALALGGLALVLRAALPEDGWFYDDAWQVLAASRAGLDDLRVAGQTQPLYNAGLALWSRVAGDGEVSMVAPALLAGALGPPAVYLALRRLRHARAIALLPAACLTAAEIHVTYSGRVKVYTIELLVVLALALALPRLARRTWRPVHAVAWVVVSALLAAGSSFLLIAGAAAGVVLVLHPCGDRALRAVAVGVQALASALVLASTQATYNSEAVTRQWESNGGFVDLSPPRDVPSDLLDHGESVVEALVDGPRWLVLLTLAASLAGLAWSAWRGPHALVARVLGLAALAALAGAVVGRVPFGPTSGGDTRRVGLWLVPVVAFGLAASLAAVRRALPPGRAARWAFDGAAVAVSVWLLVGVVGDRPGYRRSGARAATEQAIADAGPDDAVWITRPTMYSAALHVDGAVALRSAPEQLVGFLPDPADPRIHPLPFGPVPEEAIAAMRVAERVHVVHTTSFRGGPYAEQRRTIALALALSGFERASSEEVETGTVEVWERTAPAADGG